MPSKEIEREKSEINQWSKGKSFEREKDRRDGGSRSSQTKTRNGDERQRHKYDRESSSPERERYRIEKESRSPERRSSRSERESRSPERQKYRNERESRSPERRYRSERESSPDEFMKLREQLQNMKREDDEAGYDAKVERLIQLTKLEIALREKIAEKSSAQRDKISEKSSAQREKISDKSAQKSSVWEKEQENERKRLTRETSQSESNLGKSTQKERSKKIVKKFDVEHFDAPRKVDQVEEFFVKGRDSGRGGPSRGLTVSVMDSQDDGSVMFHKSVNFGKAEELGLSTHRGETEREEAVLLSAAPGRKGWEESPRALHEFESEEMKQALGERKYQEFLQKSLKEIDSLNQGKGKQSKMSESKERKAKEMDGGDQFQSPSKGRAESCISFRSCKIWKLE